MDRRFIAFGRPAKARFMKAQIAAVAAALIASSVSAEDLPANTSKELSDLDFAPIEDLPIQIAVLWGDPQTGPSAFMLKYPPNFPGGMHIHTNAYHAVVVSGGVKHWRKGEAEADAPLHRPGDYWYQSGGEWHQDSFPTGEETILFIKFDGISDTTFAE